MLNHRTLITLGAVAALSLASVAAVHADTLAQVTSRSAQGANDSLAWSQLGADGTVLGASFAAATANANPVTVTMGAANSIVSVVCTASPCSWTGTGFTAGHSLLWSSDAGNGGSGPVTINFSHSVSGAGALIQADLPGQFTGQIQVYNGTTVLATYAVSSDTAGDPIYLGALDQTGANISSVVFSLTACASLCTDFGLDTVNVTTGSTAPALTSPAPGSMTPLLGSTTFSWNPGAGSSMFALWIGTSPGTYNVYTSGHVANTVTSETVNIPANGATLYVSLWYEVGTTWADKTYTFTEAGPPSLTSPSASPLAGSTKFTWSPGAGSAMYALWIGTSPGTNNVYTSGHVANTVTSETVNIPANGATLYVSLWYELNSVWSSKSYTFTEAQPPSLTSPTTSPISGSTNFTWSAGTGSSMFALWIGSSPGASNVYTSGHVANTVTSETVNIPANGATLYVSLWYEIGTVWTSKQYTFTEAASPSLTSPTSSPLSGSTMFSWSPGNVGASMFALWVGTSPGTSNIYTSGHVANTVTSETVTIPANGATIYVTLWYELSGNWLSKSYTFTEAP